MIAIASLGNKCPEVSECLTLCLPGLMTSGQLFSAFGFITRHPDATASIMILSIAATTGRTSLNHDLVYCSHDR
jgi:p-aminobenzoyl-glutamate transporter AbgT